MSILHPSALIGWQNLLVTLGTRGLTPEALQVARDVVRALPRNTVKFPAHITPNDEISLIVEAIQDYRDKMFPSRTRSRTFILPAAFNDVERVRRVTMEEPGVKVVYVDDDRFERLPSPLFSDETLEQLSWNYNSSGSVNILRDIVDIAHPLPYQQDVESRTNYRTAYFIKEWPHKRFSLQEALERRVAYQRIGTNEKHILKLLEGRCGDEDQPGRYRTNIFGYLFERMSDSGGYVRSLFYTPANFAKAFSALNQFWSNGRTEFERQNARNTHAFVHSDLFRELRKILHSTENQKIFEQYKATLASQTVAMATASEYRAYRAQQKGN